MSNSPCTKSISTEVYFFAPAGSDWAGPVGWSLGQHNRATQIWQCDTQLRQGVPTAQAGFWEDAAFAALGLSSAAAIVAALF